MRFSCRLLIEEVPRKPHAQYAAVLRIVRREEVHSVALAGVDVAEHDEEARVLEVHVGVGVDKGVAANLHPARLVALHGKLVDLRNEVGGVVFGEVVGVGSKLHGQFVGNLELYVQV